MVSVSHNLKRLADNMTTKKNTFKNEKDGNSKISPTFLKNLGVLKSENEKSLQKSAQKHQEMIKHDALIKNEFSAEMLEAYESSLHFASTYQWTNQDSAQEYVSAVDEIFTAEQRPGTEPLALRENGGNDVNGSFGFFQGSVYSAEDYVSGSEDEKPGFYYQGSVYSDNCSSVCDFDTAVPNKIQDMWENFSVDEYAPKPEAKKKPSKWRPRITIPKPFKVAEKICATKKLSRSAALLQQERAIRQYEEELECDKRFIAREVPVTSLVPQYDKLLAEREKKKMQRIAERKQKLLETSKPFHFQEREMKKKKAMISAQQQAEQKSSNTDGLISAESQKHRFKANPVPKDILYND
eukprot:Sdes_comp9310_c0_seq1m800